MPRFIVKKGDVYYLTTGTLLTYDMGAARDERQRRGVEEVKDRFKEIYDSPHTHYPAVEVTTTDFSPANTGQVPGGP
jgi:hypothetical protein